MKSQSPCIGCKKWELCFRRGAKLMEEKCDRLKQWNKRQAEYQKRVGIS